MPLRFPPLELRVFSCNGGPRPPGFSTGWRRLPGLLVECAIEGAWELHTETGILAIPTGHAAVVPVGHRHQLVSKGVLSRWTILAWTWQGRDPLRAIPGPWVAQDDLAADLAGIIQRMAASEGDPGGLRAALIQQSEAQRLLIALLEHLGWCEPPVDPAGDRLAGLFAWIGAHLDRRLYRSGLARQAGLSPTRLHDVFIAATGLATMDCRSGDWPGSGT